MAQPNDEIRSRQAPDGDALNFVAAMFSAAIGAATKRWMPVTLVDTAGNALVAGTAVVSPAAVTVTAAAYATLFPANATRVGLTAAHLGGTVYLGLNNDFLPDSDQGVPWIAGTPFPFANCPHPPRGVIYARLKTGTADTVVGRQDW